MKAFKDARGREWRISLTIAAIDRVLELCGVDLLDPMQLDDEDGVPLCTRLRTDIRLLGRVLSELLVTTAESPLSPQELRDAFDAETKVRAWESFRQEWVDFFRHDGRNDIAALIDRQLDLLQQVIETNLAIIERGGRESISVNVSGDTLELSESTPAD